MNNTGSTGRNGSAKRMSHRSLVAIVAACLLLIGVVTTLSMQTGQAQKVSVDQTAPEKKITLENTTHRNYVTSDASGQHVVLDRQTGQTRPLTQDEARKLAEGLKQLVNQSTDGLVAVERADGSVSMDLQGRFQNVMLAKKEADGTITEACVDNPGNAAAFFEIDPNLLGIEKPVSKHRVDPAPKVEDR